MTMVKDAPGEKRRSKRGTCVYRDPSEWIGVKVPAIVCQEVFDKAQERLRHSAERSRQPAVHHLLSGLIECGECGCGFSSYRRYVTRKLITGKRRIHHKAAYKCNWRSKQGAHAPALIQRCRNPEIQTHILEAKVFAMIRDVMLDPLRLRECMDFFKDTARPDHRHIKGQLTRVESRTAAVEAEKKRLIDLYATGELSEEAYVNGNVALDGELHGLRLKRAEVVPLLHSANAVDASLREFGETARARLEACRHPESKRQFLLDYVQRVVYNRYKVTVGGPVPIRPVPGVQSSEASALAFRIEGEISAGMLYGKLRQRLPDDSRQSAWGGGRLKELSAPSSVVAV
jgi:hypothetical protein